MSLLAAIQMTQLQATESVRNIRGSETGLNLKVASAEAKISCQGDRHLQLWAMSQDKGSIKCTHILRNEILNSSLSP